MRTSKEIYESNVQYERNDVSETLKRSILSAIITGQIEAIRECAEAARTKWLTEIDKESILKLINQVK